MACTAICGMFSNCWAERATDGRRVCLHRARSLDVHMRDHPYHVLHWNQYGLYRSRSLSIRLSQVCRGGIWKQALPRVMVCLVCIAETLRRCVETDIYQYCLDLQPQSHRRDTLPPYLLPALANTGSSNHDRPVYIRLHWNYACFQPEVLAISREMADCTTSIHLLHGIAKDSYYCELCQCCHRRPRMLPVVLFNTFR